MPNERETSARGRGGYSGNRQDEFVREGFAGLIQAFEMRVHTTNSAIEEVKGDVKGINSAIRGEGANPDGLIQRVAILTLELKTVHAEVKDLKAQQSRLTWWLIGVLVSAIGGIIMLVVAAIAGAEKQRNGKAGDGLRLDGVRTAAAVDRGPALVLGVGNGAPRVSGHVGRAESTTAQNSPVHS